MDTLGGAWWLVGMFAAAAALRWRFTTFSRAGGFGIVIYGLLGKEVSMSGAQMEK